MNPIDRLFSIQEAMPLLGVKLTKFYALLDQGQIEAVKIGRRTMVSENEIRRFRDSLVIKGKPNSIIQASNKAA